MTEMNIINVAVNSTGDKRLDSAIKKIQTEFSRGIKASHNIARELEKIKNEELYTATGAENFSDFAENYFGISKSNASRLTAISEKFLHETVIDSETGKTVYVYEAYSTSKLIEMLKASPEQLAQITSDMTVAEIRALIKGETLIEEKPDTADTDTADTADTDTTDTADTDTDTADTTNSTDTDTLLKVRELKSLIASKILNDEIFDETAEDAYNNVLIMINSMFDI